MKRLIIFLAIIVIIVIACVLIINFTKSNNSGEQENETNQLEEVSNEYVEETEEGNLNYENINIDEESTNMSSEEIKINLIINNKTFSATLENNQTVNELIEMFPLTLNMSELNSNEKYYYLDSSLTTDSTNVGRINAGDIKLYGNNCLVIFYDSFNTSYSYTNLGSIDDVDGFLSELGSGSVNITFELAN